MTGADLDVASLALFLAEADPDVLGPKDRPRVLAYQQRVRTMAEGIDPATATRRAAPAGGGAGMERSGRLGGPGSDPRHLNFCPSAMAPTDGPA